MLEGLRLRMDPSLQILDRGAIFDGARHALTLHGWIVAPDFDQEGEMRRAQQALAAPGGSVCWRQPMPPRPGLGSGGARSSREPCRIER